MYTNGNPGGPGGGHLIHRVPLQAQRRAPGPGDPGRAAELSAPKSSPANRRATGDLPRRLAAALVTQAHLARRRLPKGDDRGDVPGWVLVTLMTAGLVVALWGAAGPRLVQVFNDAVDNVVGGP